MRHASTSPEAILAPHHSVAAEYDALHTANGTLVGDDQMWISVIIPSVDRREVLHETVLSLARQLRQADEILLSVNDPERDVAPETLSLPGVRLVTGPRGLTCQRNTALDRVHPKCNLITFFDDDVELDPLYLRICCQFMSQHPGVVGMSGCMRADGSVTGEVSRGEAKLVIEKSPEAEDSFEPRCGLPGGDMTIRKSIAQQIRFDTRLAFYGLYEDFDFGARCARLGRLVRVQRCQLVHLATRTSRVSGKRFGYAQVMNSHYLWRKGSMNVQCHLHTVAISLIGNLVGMLVFRGGVSRPQRIERFRGNMLGFRDVIVYGAQPERIENI